MAEIGKREFLGEVYFNGDCFTGRWSVRAGNRVTEEGEIRSLSEDGARHHVSYEASSRGFVWSTP
jgi:hypothetical protein